MTRTRIFWSIYCILVGIALLVKIFFRLEFSGWTMAIAILLLESGVFLLTGSFGLNRFRREEGDVCYLSCAESPPLLAVQRRLARGLTERGFALDDRRFVPHLTLARRVQLPPGFELSSILERPIDAPARALSLMLSERRAGRLVYTELHHT